MNHTIASLAVALRGMPRGARIVVRLPDGTELPIVLVTGRNLGPPGTVTPKAAGGGYEVILLTEGAPETLDGQH